jgi:universal stress protein E
LPKAVELAARTGARLTLFNSFFSPYPLPESSLSGEDMIPHARAERLKRLEAWAVPLRRRGIKVDCVVEWDVPPHEAIVRFVLATEPDLVMAESHHHGHLARWLLANTDWELIRACPCPVWFVKSATFSRKPSVLTAVDPFHVHAKPSRLDDRILSNARHLARQLHADLAVVHAYEVPVTYASSTIVEPVRLPISSTHAKALKQSVVRKVDQLASRFAVSKTRRFVREGRPADALLALAHEQKPDVIVMGAVSRSGLERVFIGSTAETVIDQIGCDVLIIKPTNFRTTVSRSPSVELRTRSAARA